MEETALDKIRRKYTLVIVLGISILALLIPVNIVGAAPDSNKYDLTGVWNCDDGGTYYLTQIDNTLWWYGESAPVMPVNGARWSNVVNGSIDGNTLNLIWVGVPKGDSLPNGKQSIGILTLNIVSNDELQAIKKTSGFGGSHWTRASATSDVTPTPTESPTSNTGQPYLLETDHPFAKCYSHTWNIQTTPDTTQMRIHFAKLEIGGDDQLYITKSGPNLDFTKENNRQDFWTDWYATNYMDVHYSVSCTNPGWGFKIDRIDTKNDNGKQSTTPT